MTDDKEIEFDERAFKTLIIDAVCGVGFPSQILAAECENAGMAVSVSYGQWVWRRERLQRCSIEQLQDLYEGLCVAREENSPSTLDEARTSSGLILQ